MGYFYSSVTISIPLVNDSDGIMTPVEILDEDDHLDENDRWRASSSNAPRKRMLQIVREKDLRRPASKIKNDYV